MIPLALVLYFGGVWLWALSLLVSLIAVYEFCKGWEYLNVKPWKEICYTMTVMLFATTILSGGLPYRSEEGFAVSQLYENMTLICIWLFLVVTFGLIYGWKIDERGPYDAIATVTTLVYIPFFTYHMVMIDMTPYRLFVWIVIIAAFGQDVCAYFTGYFMGKHKMAPILSPKKTIEGAIGGLVGSSLLSMLFGILFMKDSGLGNPALICFVFGLVGGAAGMAGDLTASMFKRKMGIKDYGNLIPGHGGILDRFDSVIFVAPVIYYAICILQFFGT